MSWILALLLLAVGGALGYFAARRFDASTRRVAELSEALEREREEHAAYRREVSEHFTRTAHAVNTLTESYRTVHRHLSEGARQLCDDTAAETALAFDTSRLISETAPGQAAAVEPGGEPEQEPSAENAGSSESGISAPPAGDVEPEPPLEDGPGVQAAQPPRDYAEEPGEGAPGPTRH